MLFSDNTHFDVALHDLAATIAVAPAALINPLPCDRWIARSCLQKAIRRAEPELAQRAVANLFQHDRRAAWRHLTIIALEDVGVANVGILTSIIAAQQNRLWRNNQGGDWPVMAQLVRQMAIGEHCQAACDLLLRTLNDPQFDDHRAAALDMDVPALAHALMDNPGALETKATAAMALGGRLADGQRFNDPCAVFDILGESGRTSYVVSSCRAAWKLSRNPMAFLLPIVWERWIEFADHHVVNDDMPPVQLVNGVPGYALDQFTRTGNSISRALLKNEPTIGTLFTRAGIAPAQQSKTVGDLLFLLEGGLLANRVIWPTGDLLRTPYRQLPAVTGLGDRLIDALNIMLSKARQVAKLRQLHIQPRNA